MGMFAPDPPPPPPPPLPPELPLSMGDDPEIDDLLRKRAKKRLARTGRDDLVIDPGTAISATAGGLKIPVA